MLPMHEVIIADTSCFILLDKIGALNLLQKVYGEICTTKEIAGEYEKPLPDWVAVREVHDAVRQEILGLQLDRGESSAIALALEMPDCLLILDDAKARKIAMQLHIRLTGTLGVIIKAKQMGFIPSIKPLLENIQQTNFRLSTSILSEALIVAKEAP
jgi:predicted nucleic acid-binding protein